MVKALFAFSLMIFQRPYDAVGRRIWCAVFNCVILTKPPASEAGVDLRAKQDEKYLTIAALNCASLPPTQGEPITRHQTWKIPQACRHLVFLKSWPWRGSETGLGILGWVLLPVCCHFFLSSGIIPPFSFRIVSFPSGFVLLGWFRGAWGWIPDHRCDVPVAPECLSEKWAQWSFFFFHQNWMPLMCSILIYISFQGASELSIFIEFINLMPSNEYLGCKIPHVGKEWKDTSRNESGLNGGIWEVWPFSSLTFGEARARL